MNTLSRPFPEAPTDRRTRQLDYFRRAADKCMRAADIASQQLETTHASGEPGAAASPTLDLARSTRALVLAVPEPGYQQSSPGTRDSWDDC